MEPKAILVLYEPGYKLKNSKYLLAVGANIVGRDQKCQVFINSKQYISQQYVANFFINDDFLYIEALCDDMVQLKSNLQYQTKTQRNKQTFKYIQKSTRYVLPIEQIFYIGPYKAIVQVQSKEELLKINNIINIQNFMTPGKNETQEISERHSSVMNSSRLSDRTEKIQSENQIQFEPTLVLNDYDPIMYQPTIDLSQKFSQNLNIIANDTNLKVPKSPVPSETYSKSRGPKSHTSQISNKRQIRSQPFSQQMLLDSIRRQQNILKGQLKMAQNQPQEQFSMPDTIKDQQFLDQPNNKDQVSDLDDQMPATIQDHQQIPSVNMNKIKHSQTMTQQKKQAQIKMYKSQKLGWDADKVQNMFDLFEDVQFNPQNEQSKKVNPKRQICKADYSQIDQRVLIVSSIQSLNDKKLQLTPNQKEELSSLQQKTLSPMKRISFQKNENKEKQNLIKQKKFYNVLGFKPTLQQRLLLKRRGLQLVNAPNDDYQILIIGKSSNPTPKFLLALMNNKIILTQNWLLMDNWKDYLQKQIKQNILGINWQKIDKQRQNEWKIFKGSFYLTQQIKQYQVIVKLGGGNITDKLDHRKDLNVILQPQSKLDKKFYDQKKHYKRWKFYESKIIAESIMIGQFISEKYVVDELTF